MGACFATVNNTISKVSIKGEINLKEYDRVIIGMPVWVEGSGAIGRNDAFPRWMAEQLVAFVFS